jgi:hypothetical protein
MPWLASPEIAKIFLVRQIAGLIWLNGLISGLIWFDSGFIGLILVWFWFNLV